MESLVAKLWHDDGGALIATEFLYVATILVIGIVVGLTSLGEAVNAELCVMANAALSVNPGYTISGVSGCSTVDGSQALYGPGTVTNPTFTAPSNPSVIDVPAD